MADHPNAIAQNIALLALFPGKFERSKLNPVPAGLNTRLGDDKRELSLQDEKAVAEAFSVLLAITDDPSKIGAVCVEERPEEKKILIRSAVNSGSQAKRRETLQKIAEVLENAHYSTNSVVVDEIVAVCQMRLLGRLRSRHAIKSLKSSKPPLIPKLRAAMKFGKFKRDEETLIDELNQAFASLESMSTPDARSELGRKPLMNILSATNLFIRSIDFKTTLGALPKNVSEWSGDATSNLYASLKKIAQYRFAARFLAGAARRIPALRRLEFQEVSLGPFVHNPYGASVLPARQGFLNKATRDILKRPNQTQSESELKWCFQQPVAEVRRLTIKHEHEPKRVHAEIQLLFHYMRAHDGPQPRVIVSSKHACFLCNLFIAVQGRFWTPGSHGTFYPKWRLPRPDELGVPDQAGHRGYECLERFNEALEETIRSKISQRRLKLQGSAESILFDHDSCNYSAISALPKMDSKSLDSRPKETRTFDEALEKPERDLKSPSILAESAETLKPQDASVCAAVSPISSSISRKVAHNEIGSSACIEENSSDKNRTAMSSREPAWKTDTDMSSAQVHILELGKTTVVNMRPGLSINLNSPHIHIQLSYEDVLPHATQELAIHAAWIQASLMPSCQIVELDTPWDHMELPHGCLFQKHGIVFRRKNNLIMIRAVAGEGI